MCKESRYSKVSFHRNYNGKIVAMLDIKKGNLKNILAATLKKEYRTYD